MRPISTEGLMRQQPHDPGLPPQLDWLAIEQLVIDPDYQREVKNDGRRAIERIAREFAWSKFSTVIVSPVGGADGETRYAIIDGQHRTTAAKLAGYERVPCQILRLDRSAQAASFAAINGQVTKVTTWNLYKAALAPARNGRRPQRASAKPQAAG